MIYLILMVTLAIGAVLGYLWALWRETSRIRGAVNAAYRMGREKEKARMEIRERKGKNGPE